MSNDCKFDANSILNEFKNSFFYIWFKQIDDAAILKVIQSLIDCPGTKHIFTKCKNIFCCWIVREIALVLHAFGVGSDSSGNTTVTGFDDDNFVSYVKKDVVRDESREYFKSEFKPCQNCDDFPLGKIKNQAQKYLDMCVKSRGLLGGVGTNFTGAGNCSGCCEKDEYK